MKKLMVFSHDWTLGMPVNFGKKATSTIYDFSSSRNNKTKKLIFNGGGGRQSNAMSKSSTPTSRFLSCISHKTQKLLGALFIRYLLLPRRTHFWNLVSKSTSTTLQIQPFSARHKNMQFGWCTLHQKACSEDFLAHLIVLVYHSRKVSWKSIAKHWRSIWQFCGHHKLPQFLMFRGFLNSSISINEISQNFLKLSR